MTQGSITVALFLLFLLGEALAIPQIQQNSGTVFPCSFIYLLIFLFFSSIRKWSNLSSHIVNRRNQWQEDKSQLQPRGLKYDERYGYDLALPPPPGPNERATGGELGENYMNAILKRTKINWDPEVSQVAKDTWHCTETDDVSDHLHSLSETWESAILETGMGTMVRSRRQQGATQNIWLNDNGNVKFFELEGQFQDRSTTQFDIFTDTKKNLMIIPGGVDWEQPNKIGRGIQELLIYTTKGGVQDPFFVDVLYIDSEGLSLRLFNVMRGIVATRGRGDQSSWHVVPLNSQEFLSLMETPEGYMLYYLYTSYYMYKEKYLSFSRPGTIPREWWLNFETVQVAVKFGRPPGKRKRPLNEVLPSRSRGRGH